MSPRKNKNTFRFPFDIDSRIFLGLALLFFIISLTPINGFFSPKDSIKKLKIDIEKDVERKINLFQKFESSHDLIKNIIENKISSTELNKLINTPYYLYLYKNDEAIFWNNNIMNPPLDTFISNKPLPYFDKKGYYTIYQKNIDIDTGVIAIAVFPIKNENPLNSSTFRTNFIVGDAENDYGIRLATTPKLNSKPIIIKGETVYHIYNNDDYFSINDKSGWRLFFNALPFILFGISLHTYFKVSIKKRPPIFIFSLLLGSAVSIRLLNYYFGIPTDFTQYAMFDSLHFATDSLNRSLGDSFINMCLLFWILLFFVVNVQGKIIKIYNKYIHIVIGITSYIAVLSLAIYLSNLSYEIVRDSIINFDTTIFTRLDLFSFIGILTFMTIFANFLLGAIIANNYLNMCFKWKYSKLIIVIVSYLLFTFFITPKYNMCYYYVFICLVGIFYILDLPNFRFRFDFNSFVLLLWIIIISFAGSYFMTILITEKEHQSRKEYAEKIIKIGDRQIEDKLSDMSESIISDKIISNFFKLPDYHEIHGITKYINTNYLWNNFIKYNTSIHYFDKNKNNIYQLDSLSFNTITGYNRIENVFSEVENTSIYLYETSIDKGYYAIYKFTGNDINLGYVVLQLQNSILPQKEDYNDFIYQNETIKTAKDYKYSTAIYDKDRLITKQGSYTFPYIVDRTKLLNKNKFIHIENNGNDEFWMSDPNSKKLISVVKKSNKYYLFTTLFAYIFLIYFIVISMYIIGNVIARSNLNYSRFINLLSLNLRLRIHMAILLVVFVSFIAVGYYTSYYFFERVKEKSQTEISYSSQNIQAELYNYFINNNIVDPAKLDSAIQFLPTITKLKDIANRYRINLNLFSIKNGDLLFYSEQSIYNNNLLSYKINPAAYYSLKQDNIDHFIKNEYIGDLDFAASYVFVRNSKNEPVSILQLPYISSNAEINSESTTILTTLINIYVFVFLISTLLAFFITNSVTRPFSYIVKQFTKINLSKTNQPLKWQYSDEIGLLVKEYNRMLRKLENSTVLLAKSEREMAWREMAKQVAHEIKNPLTPMKLSLQMLERAIKNNSPNITEITGKVTNTLIEQIDNLTLIATNFSNFAKMPELRKETFNLNEILYSVTGMYNDDLDFEYLFLIPDYPITIFADKGQLIRVFTNIIQNATQSIPEGRKANISLMTTKVKNNFIRITISDNGEGISKEKASKLFQPYFTTKTSGTGLGLAMCKDIIEQFGGKISFESEENVGTSFHIDLPIMNDHEEDN